MAHRLFYIAPVEGRLREMRRDEDGGHAISRFARSYYVWARDEADALDLVTMDLSCDAEIITAEAPIERRLDDVPADLRPIITLDCGRGVCWRSGRVFFPDDSS